MPASTRSATASIEQLYAWLVELSLQVRQPEHVAARIDDALRIYANKLTVYPPDIVQSVLQKWPEQNPYWPTWHELAEAIHDQQPRRQACEVMAELLNIGMERPQ